MKKIFYTICMAFGLSLAAQAQETRTTTTTAPTDTIRAAAKSETQPATYRAARQADVNAQNNQNIRKAEDKVRMETERSTGKEMKNPALTNPKTVKPPVLSDPPTSPLSGNRSN